MFDLLIGLTAAISVQTASTTPAAPAAPPLKDIPGVTVKYYDLVGNNEKALKKSLANQRPKDASGAPSVVTTEWIIGGQVQKRTENGVCKVVGAAPTFQATAEVPRLPDPAALPADVRKNWLAYIAQAEATAAADLWLVHNGLDDVRSALLASSCEGTAAAMTAATERLKALEAQAQQQRAAAAAAAAAEAAASKAPEAPPPSRY